MARFTLPVVAAGLLAAQSMAQQCYYPNGSSAPSTEKPCSAADGSACCPDNWQCLDNGLCYYPPDKLYGRYSCTDKSWGSPGCPSNMCTYGGTAYGAESITQCSNHNNDWCCNADNVNVKCCQESPAPRPFFQLQDGKAYATIGRNQASSAPTLTGVTGLASGTASATNGGGSSAAKTSAPSSITNSPNPSAVVASVSERVSTGPNGATTIREIIYITPSTSPSAAGGTNTTSTSNSKIGLIVGCAVGIPLGLTLIGIVLWMLRKRHQQKANPYGKETSEVDRDSTSSPGFVGGAAAKLGKNNYRHSRPGTTEIDGHPAGPGRPVSTINGRAELDSGTGFRPGHAAYAPDTVGLGGGNGERTTWESAPPGYSPGANQATFGHSRAASELDGSNALPKINEKAEGQQYQAYRPPAVNQEAAELPTMKTPPEDLEKQLHK